MKNLTVFLASCFMLFLTQSAILAQGGYQVGDKASDFELKAVNGDLVSLKGYDDAKGFLVIFSCNTCPYVVAYEDRMIELHNKYAPQGFPVIAINPNDDSQSPGDSFDKMKERAEDKGFPFAYAYDDTQEVTKKYGATNTPHVYLLEKSGDDFVVKYIGTIDNNYQDESSVTKKYVEDAVEAVLAGNAVPEDKTKAIGCTIKWRKS